MAKKTGPRSIVKSSVKTKKNAVPVSLTARDITGQNYNSMIKEKAAKVRLKLEIEKRKPTPREKSYLDADAAIVKMNSTSKSKTNKRNK